MYVTDYCTLTYVISIFDVIQVLGGAGPAIAAVPLTVVWAGGSFVTLATGLTRGQVGPLAAVGRVGFVLFMSIGQVTQLRALCGSSFMEGKP